MSTEDRPVHRDPDFQVRDPELVYADQEPASAGWDLAFGCRVSVGPELNGGPLRVTVNMSDRELAAGICARTASPEQVYAFAQYLIKLVAMETGQLRCKSCRIAIAPATCLVRGEPCCDNCLDLMRQRGPVETSPLPALQREPKLSQVKA